MTNRMICHILFLLMLGMAGISNSFAETMYYRAVIRDDPATTMVIAWTGDGGTVHFGKTDHGTDYTAYEMSRFVDRSTGHRGMDHHFVRLTGLEPHTVYYFVIRDIYGNVSPRMSIMTLPDDPEATISFVNGGDTRRGVTFFEPCNCRQARQDGNILISKLRPDFVAFNGDFVRNTLGGIFPEETNSEWKTWFDDWQLTIGPEGRLAPLVVATGNHEDNVDALGVTNPDFNDLYKMFDVAVKDVYYGITFGGCLFRMYSLNTEIDACADQNQLNWLTNDLQNHSAPSNTPYWKFANYHHPVIPHSNYDNQVSQYNCWVPLFEEYGVKLVMESHTHAYKTTWPVLSNGNLQNDNGFTRNDEDGVVYIGEGNWAAPQRSLYPRNPWTREQALIRSFFFIQVNKDSVSVWTTIFENLENIQGVTDNVSGSGLPEGVVLYDESKGAEYGEVLVIRNSVESAICIEDTVGTPIRPDEFRSFSRIYPNPAEDIVYISLEQTAGKVEIEVYDALGKMCHGIIANRISADLYSLDVRQLCSGVNFILVKNQRDIESHKFIRK